MCEINRVNHVQVLDQNLTGFAKEIRKECVTYSMIRLRFEPGIISFIT
jgi:hypothetical protein